MTVNIKSIAPVDDETEWKWNTKAHKWVRTNDLSKLTHSFMMKQQKDQNNEKALEKNADQYYQQVHNARVHNQEANAWIHENYNDPYYYEKDINNKQPYNKYLASLSDDQLHQGFLFWEKQVQTTDKHNSKDKLKWTQSGDAVDVHNDQNFGNGNKVYGLLTDGKHYPLPFDNVLPNADAKNNSNSIGKAWNNSLYNQEHLKMQINNSTSRNNNYKNLVHQYNQAKQTTNSIQLKWQNYVDQFGAHTHNWLKLFFKAEKKSLSSKYYQDGVRLNHDNYRIQQFKNYMNQRRQQNINASIRSQIANNTNNHLTSIWRKDKQTDTVIGFAENQPQESLDMNMSNQSIDSGMPQTNYASVNQYQLTDQGDLYDRPLAFNPMNDDNAQQQSREDQYNVLWQWMKDSVIVSIQGFNQWQTCLIQSISKTPDQTATDNGMTIQLTIQHVRLANIVWGKQKAKGGISKGRNQRKSGNSKYTVRPGDNMWDIAKKQHCGWHALMNANPQIKNKNLIYPKQKLVIPK